jgi:hypothetical protein
MCQSVVAQLLIGKPFRFAYRSLDYPIARNGSEPRNDFCVLAKGLLNAKQNRAVELPPLWLGCVRVEDKQFHAAADTGRETAYVDGTKFPAGI